MPVDSLDRVAPRSRGCCAPVAEPGVSETEARELGKLLAALSHPIRLRIVDALRVNADPVCQCDLVATFPLDQSTISRHLKTLIDAGLIASERRGLWAHYYIPNDSRIKEVAAWLR